MNKTDENTPDALRQQLLTDLAPMASLAYQRRYIVCGDVQHGYLLPDELLNNLHYRLTRFRSHPESHSAFSLPQFAALDQLFTLLDALPTDIDSVPNEELVERHAGWGAVREQCAVCLTLLGFDLAEWEANDLNENSRNA